MTNIPLGPQVRPSWVKTRPEPVGSVKPTKSTPLSVSLSLVWELSRPRGRRAHRRPIPASSGRHRRRHGSQSRALTPLSLPTPRNPLSRSLSGSRNPNPN